MNGMIASMLVASLLGGAATSAHRVQSTRASTHASTSSTVLGALGIPLPRTQPYPRTRVYRRAQANGSARPTWYTDAQGCRVKEQWLPNGRHKVKRKCDDRDEQRGYRGHRGRDTNDNEHGDDNDD